MRTLIVYETVHGSAGKCAELLKEKINHDVDVIRLRDNEHPDLSKYDIVVVGGSIHMGVIHTRIRNFVEKHFEKLMRKPHALFLVCIETGKVAEDEFNTAYPEELRKTSVVNGIFGGELLFKKMNMFEKLITKKVVRVNKTISRLNYDEIEKFANHISAVGTSPGNPIPLQVLL